MTNTIERFQQDKTALRAVSLVRLVRLVRQSMSSKTAPERKALAVFSYSHVSCDTTASQLHPVAFPS